MEKKIDPKAEVLKVYPDATMTEVGEGVGSMYYIWRDERLSPIGISFTSEEHAWRDTYYTHIQNSLKTTTDE